MVRLGRRMDVQVLPKRSVLLAVHLEHWEARPTSAQQP